MLAADRRPAAARWHHIAELPPEEAYRNVMRDILCPVCMDDFATIHPPVCTCCGEPFKSRADAEHLCGDCISREKHFFRARAFGIYEGTLLELIHAFKYRGRTELAKPFGLLLYMSFVKYFADVLVDLIAPVPLHHTRLRSRGYNQAFLMVRRWAGGFSTPTNPAAARPAIVPGLLIRARNTPAQAGLDRRARIRNLKNAFALTDPERIAGKTVLLVDDVLTTGSTAEECARVLVGAGAARVGVLALARAV